MHAKYGVSISYGSKVMIKVKFFATESKTGHKLDALEFHSGGMKINAVFLLTRPILFYRPESTDFIGKLVATEQKGDMKL